MWSLNSPPCGPRTAFQIGHCWHIFWFPSFCLNPPPIYSVCCTNSHLRCLNLRQKNWSYFQTFENQFELLSGRFVDPELPFKFSPRMQAKKKKKTTTKKWQQRETQTLLSAERTVFGKNMEETFDNLLALGLLAFFWPKASKHNSAKKTL